MTTIDNNTSSVDAVWHAVTGGKFRIRLLPQEKGSRSRWGIVLNDKGEQIGDANDYTYGSRGFAVHTGPYGGFVSIEQIEFVD